MGRLTDYLMAPEHLERPRTCRLKKWAHDNAIALYWLNFAEVALLVWLVIACH